MVETLKVGKVFIPNGQLTVTYVIRSGRSLEQDLRNHFDTDNIVVSISGPSKTGKTVLLRNVLDIEYVISLSGSSIKTVEDFFEQIFSWIEVPAEEWETSEATTNIGASGGGSGDLSIPFITKGSVEGSVSASRASTKARSNRMSGNPFQRVIQEIADSDFTIFVDDFHCIPEETQIGLAKIIKGLAESKVRICTASVPHRSEDVVRANPELRGRLASVDIGEWDESDLIQIATQGLKALNIATSEATKKN